MRKVFYGVADSDLRRQMNDGLGTAFLEYLGQVLPVRHIDTMEGVPAERFQQPQPILLEPDIVVIIEIVDADDLFPAFEQPSRDGRADETRDPRDQIGHLAGLPCCQFLPATGTGRPIA